MNEATMQAVADGLDELRQRVKSGRITMAHRGAPTVSIRLRITKVEQTLRDAMQVGMTIHSGKPVVGSLIVRLALMRLAADVTKSMRDPKLAAELTAGLKALQMKTVEAE